MLTWWVTADIHINEDDPLQQNFYFTLQAMALDRKEENNRIKIPVHKEVESTINTIFEHELSTWVDCCMRKVVVFTTGTGDILFKILFKSSAVTFLQTEVQAKQLKTALEVSLLTHFAVSVSPNLVRVSRIAIQGEEVPKLECENKVAVVVIATDNSEPTEVGEDPIKDCITHSYSVPEAQATISNFYAESPEFLLDCGGEASDMELMNMF